MNEVNIKSEKPDELPVVTLSTSAIEPIIDKLETQTTCCVAPEKIVEVKREPCTDGEDDSVSKISLATEIPKVATTATSVVETMTIMTCDTQRVKQEPAAEVDVLPVKSSQTQTIKPPPTADLHAKETPSALSDPKLLVNEKLNANKTDKEIVPEESAEENVKTQSSMTIQSTVDKTPSIETITAPSGVQNTSSTESDCQTIVRVKKEPHTEEVTLDQPAVSVTPPTTSGVENKEPLSTLAENMVTTISHPGPQSIVQVNSGPQSTVKVKQEPDTCEELNQEKTSTPETLDQLAVAVTPPTTRGVENKEPLSTPAENMVTTISHPDPQSTVKVKQEPDTCEEPNQEKTSTPETLDQLAVAVTPPTTRGVENKEPLSTPAENMVTTISHPDPQSTVKVKQEPDTCEDANQEKTSTPETLNQLAVAGTPPTTRRVENEEPLSTPAENMVTTISHSGPQSTVKVKQEPNACEEANQEKTSTPETTFLPGLPLSGADNLTADSALQTNRYLSQAEQTASINISKESELHPATSESNTINAIPNGTGTTKNSTPTESTEKPENSLQTAETAHQSVVRIKPEPQWNNQAVRSADDSDEDEGATPERPVTIRAPQKSPTATPNSSNVKLEPFFEIPDNIPEDYFDDLLENADQLAEGLSGASPLPQVFDVDEVTTSKEAQNHTNIAPTTSHDSMAQEVQNKEISGSQVHIKNEPNKDTELNHFDDGSDLLASNFFDDLLVDHVSQRSARIAEETKYSHQLQAIREQIRQLDEGEELLPEKQNHSQKHKNKKSKSKKKSRKHREKKAEEESTAIEKEGEILEGRKPRKRKRSHSNSKEDDRLPSEMPQFNVNYGNLSKCPPMSDVGKREAVACAGQATDDNDDVIMHFPQPFLVKSEQRTNVERDIECLAVQGSSSNNSSGFKRIKLEKPTSSVKLAEPLVLTPATKRQNALRLAYDTLDNFEVAPKKPHSRRFYFTSTVRKLPASTSVAATESYENRSPLHTINNVYYTFSSTSKRFNLHDWGLESLPKIAAKVARLVGYDADVLFNKINSKKLSRKYLKLKKEVDWNSESVGETKSSFFTHAMTQTDDVYVLSARRDNARDIGVQVRPAGGSIATQTTATSVGASPNDDLPLMQFIKVFNENQLLALNDFAELINESASTAMDMYRLRTRMLEIYKCSQLPSALAAVPVQAPAPVPAPAFIAPTNQPPSHMEFVHQQNEFSAYNQRVSNNAQNIRIPPYVKMQQQLQQKELHQQQQKELHQQQQHKQQQQQQQQQHQQHPAFTIRDPRSLARSYTDPRLNAIALGAHQQRQTAPSHKQPPPPNHDVPMKNYGRGSLKR